jgi:hypothetical protein
MGCHKGGTTWLDDYLSSRANADLEQLREHHFLDNYFLQECSFAFERRLSNARQLIDAKLGACADSIAALWPNAWQ